ncbi:MAG: glycosyltransferase family 39 protein, partial [Thermodesulfobacteriota bacterium]
MEINPVEARQNAAGPEKLTPAQLCAVFVLLLSFLAQAILSMRDDAPTFDELINPSVGYAELFTRDFGFIHDHPPLGRIVTALPLLFLKPDLPPLQALSERGEESQVARYGFSNDFFYEANDNADELLFWSRVPVVFLSLLLALAVFLWARELYGNYAGLFALFLYCFEPNIIAHSRFTGKDLPVVLFTFLTIYLFWRYARTPSVTNMVSTGACLGLALLSKYSAIMLFPMLLVLAVLTPGRTSKRPFTTLVGVSAVAAAVIFLLYGTQWRIFASGVYNAVAHYQGTHPAFLMGEYSREGWWYYFPIAFLIKTPIPLLTFIACALI